MRARLTRAQVAEIAQLRADGKSFREIGRITGVKPKTAQGACQRSGVQHKPVRVPEYTQEEVYAAKEALAEQIRLARLESLSAPLFRCRVSEIDRFVS